MWKKQHQYGQLFWKSIISDKNISLHFPDLSRERWHCTRIRPVNWAFSSRRGRSRPSPSTPRPPGTAFWSSTTFLRYSVFHRFREAKFANGGSILSSSQFLMLPQLPQKMKLVSKVVKIDPKIIISLPPWNSLYETGFFPICISLDEFSIILCCLATH